MRCTCPAPVNRRPQVRPRDAARHLRAQFAVDGFGIAPGRRDGGAGRRWPALRRAMRTATCIPGRPRPYPLPISPSARIACARGGAHRAASGAGGPPRCGVGRRARWGRRWRLARTDADERLPAPAPAAPVALRAAVARRRGCGGRLRVVRSRVVAGPRDRVRPLRGGEPGARAAAGGRAQRRGRRAHARDDEDPVRAHARSRRAPGARRCVQRRGPFRDRASRRAFRSRGATRRLDRSGTARGSDLDRRSPVVPRGPRPARRRNRDRRAFGHPRMGADGDSARDPRRRPGRRVRRRAGRLARSRVDRPHVPHGPRRRASGSRAHGPRGAALRVVRVGRRAAARRGRRGRSALGDHDHGRGAPRAARRRGRRTASSRCRRSRARASSRSRRFRSTGCWWTSAATRARSSPSRC